MTICTNEHCKNSVFKSLNKCALHCVKNSYNQDWSSLLFHFNQQLRSYILNHLIKYNFIYNDIDNNIAQKATDFLESNENLYENEYFISVFNQIEMVFRWIHFPTRDSRDSFDYVKTLKLFKGIHFDNCVFYLNRLHINPIKVFFQDCVFKVSHDVGIPNLLENVTNSIYSSCVFDNNVSIVPTEKEKIIKVKLFDYCTFKKKVEIRNVILESEVFKFRKEPEFDMKNHENITEIDSIHIENCIFNKKLKLNNLSVQHLFINNTEFHDKLELKNTNVKELNFLDSNVEKVFDAFESYFTKAKFYKSIFEDFAGFERVEFGLEGNQNSDYRANFIYTTFMDFSNFRETKFHSGLDFQSVNLKQLPNFLHTEVSQENTNRETFRIIKHSFDFVGNKIEANQFFAQEMITYKNELKDNTKFINLFKYIKVPSNKDWWIFTFNEFISDFGNNYIRPITLLFLVVYLYTAFSHVSFNIPFNSNILDYAICIMVFFAISRTIYNKLDDRDNKFTLLFLSIFAWFMVTLYFIGHSPLHISSFIFYLLNSMVENLAILRIFKDKRTIFDLLFFITCSVLIWQIVVSIKRRVQR